MTTNSIELRKVRDFGEILNTMFAFLRENFVNILKSCLPIALPIVIAGSIVVGFSYSKFFGSLVQNMPVTMAQDPATAYPPVMPDFSSFGLMFLGYFVLLIGMLIYFAGLYQYIILYLDHPKDQITFSLVWNGSKGKLLPFIGISFLVTILVFAGFIFFVIPGIYMMIPLSFTFVIYAAERKGIFDSIGRSFRLLKGEWWSTLGLALVVLIIQYAISLVAMIPFYIVIFVLMFHNVKEGVPDASGYMSGMGTAYGIFMPVIFLITLVTTIIQITGIAMKYFSIVEQREGIGMMQKVEQLGGAGANV